MAEIFFSVLTISISMTPIIAVMIVFTPILNKIYKYGWTYWLWLGISLRLVMPFSLGVIFPFQIKLPVSGYPSSANTANGHTSAAGNLVSSAGASGFNLNIFEIMVLIYLIGVITFMMFNLINYVIFRKYVKKCSKSVSKEIIETASEVCSAYGIGTRRQNIDIRLCKKITGPMVVGIFKPMLLIPREDYDYIKRKMILSHEIIHIKRYDTAYKFMLLIVCSIHWFNPFVHIMCRRANDDLEVSCDIRVLKDASVEERKIYSYMLIDIASQSRAARLPALFMGFGNKKNGLKFRIKNIFGSSSKKGGHTVLVMALLIVLLFGTAVQIGYPTASGQEITVPTVSPHAPDNMTQGDNTVNPNDDTDEDMNSSIDETNGNNEQMPDSAWADEHEFEPSSAEVVIIDLKQLDNN